MVGTQPGQSMTSWRLLAVFSGCSMIKWQCTPAALYCVFPSEPFGPTYQFCAAKYWTASLLWWESAGFDTPPRSSGVAAFRVTPGPIPLAVRSQAPAELSIGPTPLPPAPAGGAGGPVCVPCVKRDHPSAWTPRNLLALRTFVRTPNCATTRG